MDKISHQSELAAFLGHLKEKSGRSYQWIGWKVNASKSTVHRYCSGLSVPQEFGMIERIGRACGAGSDEIGLLFRLWADATATPNGVSPQDALAPVTDRKISPAVAASAPSPPSPVAHIGYQPLRPRMMRAIGVVVLLALTVSASTWRPTTPQAAAQWITGPTWMRPPAAVPSTLFGVTVNSATGNTPAFRVGALRLWDSGTRWAQIQGRRGEFDWAILDRHIASAARADLPVLFVFGGTPSWASPGGTLTAYSDGSRASPPDSLDDWDTFLEAVVKRYRGRIEAYELWVLGNDRRFFAGRVETLIEMTQRGSRMIKTLDPKATVVCPGMGNLWTTDGQQILKRFAELGGYQHCDVAGIKLFQRTASDPPETMLEVATIADRAFHESGIHPRVWNTGTTYTIPLQDSLPERQARDYAVRFFLVGIYARYLNLERMYFYNWGGTRIPLVLQADGGAPTRAALAVEQLQRWLAHAMIRSCGHGLPINLPGSVWQCEFTVNAPAGNHDATIRWTDGGTAATTAEPRTKAIHRLDGSIVATRPGDTITVTEEAILIEYFPR